MICFFFFFILEGRPITWGWWAFHSAFPSYSWPLAWFSVDTGTLVRYANNVVVLHTKFNCHVRLARDYQLLLGFLSMSHVHTPDLVDTLTEERATISPSASPLSNGPERSKIICHQSIRFSRTSYSSGASLS